MTESRTFGRWLRTGVSSILEHALFSIASLVAGVWVARELGEDAFGVFAITGGVALLIVAVHHALVAEPMIALASGKFADRGEAYLRAVARAHVRALLPITVVLGAAGGIAWLADRRTIAEAVLGLAVSLGPTLLMTTLRRAASAQLRAGRAAIGAACYLAATAGLLYVLAREGAITIFSAIATGGAASLVAAAFYALARPAKTAATVDTREILREHWRYGRAGIGAGLLAWVPHNLFYFVLPMVADEGLAAAANLRAAMNLISPAFQLNGALGTVLVPILSARQREAPLTPRRLVPFAGAFLAVDVALWLVCVLADDQLIALAYHGEYRATAEVLGWLALIPVITGVSTVVRSWAFALEYPEAQLWAAFFGAAATAAAIPFTGNAPLSAATAGMLVAHASYCVAVSYFVVRRSRTR